MLRKRIYTVAVLLPVFIGGLFLAPVVVWALMLALLVLIGAWEWGILAGWGKALRLTYVLVMATSLGMLWQVSDGHLADVQTVSRFVFGVSLLFWLMVVPLWLRGGWRVRWADLDGKRRGHFTASTMARFGAVAL